ncbi:MAG TPA: sorbosone dehydrogenase family protein [Stellaceae bacterium]|nr:sorbosone dehydrogenase family protein [Stellaceae bacterium]
MRSFDRLLCRRSLSLFLALPLAIAGTAVPGTPTEAAESVLSGDAAYGDWTTDAPGVTRRITPADLPWPYATHSVSHVASIARRPEGALPKVPPGFKVEAFATGLSAPRLLRTAPDGEIFLAEMAKGAILVLRDNGPGKPATVRTYAKGLDEPFGLAFYPPGPDPQYLYVGTIGAVLRFAYRNGDAVARGAPETVVPHLPDGGHSTRDVMFSRNGRVLFVSVGSASNDQEGGSDETLRADILAFDPDGGAMRRFATGIRNPVGLAIHPATGDLWTAVNERDGLGDDLPPDYVTRVREGGFYGWPWYYIGDHRDPRHPREHPELVQGIVVPDVLIQPHSAPLQLAVYTGTQFPAEYRGDLFVALHGSWNRSRRTGYKVVRIKLRDGEPAGTYQDFLTGFVAADDTVWGRPVGVAVAADGSLLVSEDANGTVWRISYAAGL